MNPGAYVAINCRDYLPPDHDEVMMSRFRPDPELSKDDYKKLHKIAGSKRSEDQDTKVKLAREIDLPEEILFLMITKDKYNRIPSAIANRSYLPYNIIEMLSRSSSDTKQIIADRKDLPTNIINRLLMDKDDERVRIASYQNYLRHIDPFQDPETLKTEVPTIESRQKETSLPASFNTSPSKASNTVSEESNGKKCPNCGSAAQTGEFCPDCGRYVD